MAEDDSINVLVIGAGYCIGGRHYWPTHCPGSEEGIACTVYESEPSATHYRAAEWGMSIQWGILLLRQCLPDSLFDRLLSAANDPFFTPPDPNPWIPIPWDDHNGRITLDGDAAHPMTFQRGQGMNHGIADAASLVDKLKSALKDHTSTINAIRAYNTEMISRAGDEVMTSKENTEMLHDWSRMQDSPIMQRGGHARSED